MSDLYWLNQIQYSDRNQVGDKAFYLADLLHRGYPVIPGCVVSAQAFRQFLETMNWLEPLFADLPNSSLHIDVDDSNQLQTIARQIRQAIVGTPLPDALSTAIDQAVNTLQTPVMILRPSLAVQTDVDPLWSVRTAGLLEAKVCWATPEALKVHLRQVWAELFRAKSLFYWQRSQVQLQQINLAVLIQPLFDATATGSLNINADSIYVQAVRGLGLPLSRGEAQPERVWVSLTGTLQQRQLGYQTQMYRLAGLPQQPAMPHCLNVTVLDESHLTDPIVSEAMIEPLVHLGQTTATELGMSLQLEWVYGTTNTASASQNPQLYLVQASPQSTLPLEPAAQPEPQLMNRGANHQPAVTEGEPTTAILVSGLAASMGQVMATAMVMHDPHHFDPDLLPPGAILVTRTVTPGWLPLLKRVGGIVAEDGGMTCHGAIIARELGIPAIVGATNATQIIQTGRAVHLDGDRGIVYAADRSVISTPVEQYSRRLVQAWTEPLSERYVLPTATSLWVNLSQLRSLQQVQLLPVEGLGLLRSELMFVELLEGRSPQAFLEQYSRSDLIQRIVAQLTQVVQAFHPRPVFYRSLDWRSHEFPVGQPTATTSSADREINPVLGIRGTFSYQADPDLFDLELAALAQVQQSGYTNLNLMLPFVRTVEEFSFSRQRVERAGLMQAERFQLWIMAEVPSVLFLLPDYVKAGVQGISIGTNDLTQLLLGVDRDQIQMANVFNERHPAVLAAIAQLIKTARQQGIPCSICGQAPAQYPELIESLIRWGITSISVEPAAVQATHHAIVRAEKRILLELAQRRD